MAIAHVRKGDTVIVVAGNERGKTGKVLRVDPKKERVYVEGINIVKRHQRPLPNAPQIEAGVIEREASIHISNVALVDPKDHKPTRVGHTTNEQGKRVRIARRSGAELD